MDPTAEEIAAAAKVKADADAAAAKVKADADAAAAKAAELKFSQSDLDKIAGTARNEGRTAFEKELLEKLGVTDMAAAEAAVKAAKDAEEAGKTELQRVTEERDAAKTKAEQAEQLALRAVATNRLEGALRDAGLKPDRLTAAMKLVDLTTLSVQGTDVTGVSEAVEGLKGTSPEWFGARTSPPDASGPTGTPTDFRTDGDAASKELYEKYGIRT